MPSESTRERLTALFTDVGKHYQARDKATFEVHQGNDVHAFYRLTGNPTRVIHVQGYHGFSSGQEAYVWARLMDYDRMMASRSGGCSIGDEHGASVLQFPNFRYGTKIPYDAAVLMAKLEENVEALQE